MALRIGLFIILTIALACTLSGPILIQSIQNKCIRPYSAYLFIDILPQVGYVENASSVSEARISEVFSQALKYG